MKKKISNDSAKEETVSVLFKVGMGKWKHTFTRLLKSGLLQITLFFSSESYHGKGVLFTGDRADITAYTIKS